MDFAVIVLFLLVMAVLSRVRGFYKKRNQLKQDGHYHKSIQVTAARLLTTTTLLGILIK